MAEDRRDGLPEAQLLHEMRRETRWTQAELAVALGITQSHYSRIEAGRQALLPGQWIALGPYLALDTEAVPYRGRTLAVAELRFLLAWPPATLASLRFAQDEEGNVAHFGSGLDACAAAAMLGNFGAPCVVLPASRNYATIEALFHVGGVSQALSIDDCAGRPGADSMRAVEFVQSALRRAARGDAESEAVG